MEKKEVVRNNEKKMRFGKVFKNSEMDCNYRLVP